MRIYQTTVTTTHYCNNGEIINEIIDNLDEITLSQNAETALFVHSSIATRLANDEIYNVTEVSNSIKKNLLDEIKITTIIRWATDDGETVNVVETITKPVL